MSLTCGQASVMSAGHDARPFERPFFAAGDARADEQQPGFFELFACGGWCRRKSRVAAVDDDVALAQQRLELVDHGIDRRAGLDHHHHLPRRFQAGDEVLQRVIAVDAFGVPSA